MSYCSGSDRLARLPRLKTALLFALVGGLACLGLTAPAARAHGGKLQVARATAGPYLVSVWTWPHPARVGRLDVTVAVMHPATGEAVSGVKIQVAAAPTAGAATPVRATLEAGSWAALPHADLDVGTVGIWRVAVIADGPAGPGQVAFDLAVEPPRAVAPWFVAAGGIVLAALLWRGLRRGRERRGQRSDAGRRP